MSDLLSSKTGGEKILSVSALTEMIRGRLASEFRQVMVEGEISNWSEANSGHCYFNLKDDNALMNCVMFRRERQACPYELKEGIQVRAKGNVDVFPPRGQYQLIVSSLALAGEGELWRRFQLLKEKLEKEGLFAEERKRPLPPLPATVGVITSPTGAAIRDIFKVLKRRAPGLSVILYPARVQGRGAALEIARGVRALGRSGRIETLIVGRGGGSLEDLWEFNDENLAREIAACPVPVVSAVGHEVDFTIADFVSDQRAPTPSAAAEIVSEGYVNIRERVTKPLQRLELLVEGRIRENRRHVAGLLASHALRQPELRLRELQMQADLALKRIPEVIQQRLDSAQLQLRGLTGSLEGHNPELILRKGYAIVRKAKDGKVLMEAKKLRKNLPVEIQLKDGKRRAVVTDDEARDLFM